MIMTQQKHRKSLNYFIVTMPPPAVADPNATALLNNAYAGGLPNVETRVGRASKRARLARELEAAGSVTVPELGEQEAFLVEESLGVVGAGAGLPAAAPAWAVAMNANMNNQFANVNGQLVNIQARQTNAVATEHGDPILPITAAGANPPGFYPNTYGELLGMGNGQCQQLLIFYGQPPNPVASRNLRLRKFLGAK